MFPPGFLPLCLTSGRSCSPWAGGNPEPWGGEAGAGFPPSSASVGVEGKESPSAF